jgi:hypothetical protein
MYMKAEELGWKENHGIETIGIEDIEDNVINERQVLKIWENYIKKLCNGADATEDLEVKVKEEVGADEKCPYILHSELE